MGASQSTNNQEQETVILSDTPIQFSQDVVNHLADASASSDVSTDRQSTLDAHIRSRIQGEIQRLRQEEEGVRKEIQNVLEKEVLALDGDIARSRDSETDEPGAPLHSIVLLGDVEEVKQKVDKYHTRLSSGEADTMKSTASALLTCYKNNPTTSLNCWKEVADFRATVAQAEQQHLHSIQ